LILQDGGHSVDNLLTKSDLNMSDIKEDLNLSVCHILTKYLNPRPIYYYFRFMKTNGRHILILLSISIWSIHCHRHVILQWPAEFCTSWMIAEGVMMSYWFYKIAAIPSQIYIRFPFSPRLTFMKV